MDRPSESSESKSLPNFTFRRTMERLREGIFDTLAVQQLTADTSRLNTVLDAALRSGESSSQNHQALASSFGSSHLCVVGAYGQGKSHTLEYFRNRAQGQGYVTSMVSLDPKELPLHQLPRLYSRVMTSLEFPSGEANLAARWRLWLESTVGRHDLTPKNVEALVPPQLPSRYRLILTALGSRVGSVEPISTDVGAGSRGVLAPHVSSDQCPSKTDRDDAERDPSECSGSRGNSTRKGSGANSMLTPLSAFRILSRALLDPTYPAGLLKQAIKARGIVSNESLVCSGTSDYLQLFFGLDRLLRQLGHKGWVVLFDEGEAIAQLPLTQRALAYQFLDGLFRPPLIDQRLHAIFGFTDEFFQCVQNEDFQREINRRGVSMPFFPLNYAQRWSKLNMLRLSDITDQQWFELGRAVAALHARAYRWSLNDAQLDLEPWIREAMGMETRARLKLLIYHLDILQQDLSVG